MKFRALILLSLLASCAHAEVLGTPSISSTSTSATVTLTRSANDLTIINDSASANESYIRVFWCGEPAVAAVAATAPALRLEPGESISLKYGPGDGGFGGYCSISHVTAAAETATLRLVAK